MLTRENFKGVFVMLVTPIDKRMRVDYEAHAQNVNCLIESGVSALVVCPSWNGEVHALSRHERERLLRLTVAESRGRALCIADCSATSTADAQIRARRAVEQGADGVLSMVPYAIPLSNAEMLRYWRDLAASVPHVGVIAYNRGGPTRISDADFSTLADVPNFLGSKLAGGAAELASAHQATPQKHLGLEAVWAEAGRLGIDCVAAAWIYGCPAYMVRWWQAICNQDAGRAVEMQAEVRDLLQSVVLAPMRAGYCEPSALKAFIQAIGFIRCGPPRLPSFPVPQDMAARIRDEMEARFPQFLR